MRRNNRQTSLNKQQSGDVGVIQGKEIKLFDYWFNGEKPSTLATPDIYKEKKAVAASVWRNKFIKKTFHALVDALLNILSGV